MTGREMSKRRTTNAEEERTDEVKGQGREGKRRMRGKGWREKNVK